MSKPDENLMELFGRLFGRLFGGFLVWLTALVVVAVAMLLAAFVLGLLWRVANAVWGG